MSGSNTRLLKYLQYTQALADDYQRRSLSCEDPIERASLADRAANIGNVAYFLGNLYEVLEKND